MLNNFLEFNSNRRFGVEIELNSFDNRDFKKRPLRLGEIPAGMHTLANIVKEASESSVIIKSHHFTHNNNVWVLKPDSSCGLEICSPPMKGRESLESIIKVIAKLGQHPSILCDQRCSLHIHLDVSDLSTEDLAKILIYWVKCEMVFLDATPDFRKKNRYCLPIGWTDFFSHNSAIDPLDIIQKFGSYKYMTANSYHYCMKSRKTIEFRIIENKGCVHAATAENWIKLILHFVEMTLKRPLPRPFKNGDPWSSFLWLDPKDVFYLLGFYGNYELSDEMQEIRRWFALRLLDNKTDLGGLWAFRQYSTRQIDEIVKDLRLIDSPKD